MSYIHLITGGTGSIGSALLRRLLQRHPNDTFRVLSRNDSAQHELARTLSPADRARIRFILGDIRASNIGRYITGVTKIWHCAAVKHVVGANYNADECASINIQGTANLLTAAHEEAAINRRSVSFILLSTDKAANPANIMGATKFCAEQIVLRATWASANLVRRVVRFGNVFNSRGSVYPTFLQNLKEGRTSAITSFNATRYVMSIRQAVETLIKAEEIAAFFPFLLVPLMRKATVLDFWGMACEATGRNAQCAQEAPYEIVGLQPGEKLHESILSDYEVQHCREVVLGNYGHSYYIVTDHRGLQSSHLPENGMQDEYAQKLLSSKHADPYQKIDVAIE